MRRLALGFAVVFLALSASPIPASAEPITTEVGAQAMPSGKAMVKRRDCSKVGWGYTGWRAREARRLCRMGQG
jgi:hypothetical protein